MSTIRELSGRGAQVPENILELRAAEQRRRLQRAFGNLRETTAEKVDLRNVARNHLWPATGVAALCGLIVGYTVAGWFASSR